MLPRMTITYGEDILYKKGCGCALCVKIRNLIAQRGCITTGGWCDPRRSYSESEKNFLERVPDGFLKWPKDHEKETRYLERWEDKECQNMKN